MTVFRPCIDLHDGRVKQIVGGSLRDDGSPPAENFVADEPPEAFADRYRQDRLPGGHVIKLGPGNDLAAERALAAFPGGLHLGGSVTPDNAALWLSRGADKVIVTSYMFEDGVLSMTRVERIAQCIGPERLVLDLSCRKVDGSFRVATERWQKLTETPVDEATLRTLAPYCAEFLVHAADAEGKCQGIDERLVELLGATSPLPCTYAGGGHTFADLPRVEALSQGRVDLTFGSALDLFGGHGVRYQDCVAWNRTHER